jgi:hypothetical protein
MTMATTPAAAATWVDTAEHFLVGGTFVAALSALLTHVYRPATMAVLYSGIPFAVYYFVYVAHRAGGRGRAQTLLRHLATTTAICALFLGGVYAAVAVAKTGLVAAFLVGTALLLLVCASYVRWAGE